METKISRKTVKPIIVDPGKPMVCPACRVTIVDMDNDQQLPPQPACPHVRFIYANGEAFEYIEPELETKIKQDEDKADELDELFDTWEALRKYTGPNELILEQTTTEIACNGGPIFFTVWVGLRK